MNKPAVVTALLIAALWLGAGSCAPGDPKLKQYLVEGEQLYVTHCSNCHQRDGKGLRKVYPPLAGSDYLDSHFREVICGMKYGLQGEITVNGIKYNQAMPGVIALTELELAEIATYVYTTWGQPQGIIDPRQVGMLLDSCARPRSRR